MCAEGDDDEVRGTFPTHVVEIQGAGLSVLLADLAAQAVTELVEPGRTAKFSQREGPLITGLSVSEVLDEEES